MIRILFLSIQAISILLMLLSIPLMFIDTPFDESKLLLIASSMYVFTHGKYGFNHNCMVKALKILMTKC